MATEVKVPPVGESISSGILAVWHVKDGDQVKQDQVLFELETDKITSEGLAEVAGRISLKVAEGDDVDIGQVVATIDESASGEPDSEPADEPKDEKPASEEKPAETKIQSPAVRRVAAETGIDPDEVDGTGKDGRVTKGDMLKAQENSTPAVPPPIPATPEKPKKTEGRTSRKK